jgi:hypothetical protein
MMTLSASSGGVVAWDMNEKAVAKTYELILPPGAQAYLAAASLADVVANPPRYYTGALGGSSYTDPVRKRAITLLSPLTYSRIAAL